MSKQKNHFTVDEDIKLIELVKEFGVNSWEKIAEQMPGRNIRQVRERWQHYLSPTVNNGPWTKEEELLKQKYLILGPKWKEISEFFPGRTIISIRNRIKRVVADKVEEEIEKTHENMEKNLDKVSENKDDEKNAETGEKKLSLADKIRNSLLKGFDTNVDHGLNHFQYVVRFANNETTNEEKIDDF